MNNLKALKKFRAFLLTLPPLRTTITVLLSRPPTAFFVSKIQTGEQNDNAYLSRFM